MKVDELVETSKEQEIRDAMRRNKEAFGNSYNAQRYSIRIPTKAKNVKSWVAAKKALSK